MATRIGLLKTLCLMSLCLQAGICMQSCQLAVAGTLSVLRVEDLVDLAPVMAYTVASDTGIKKWGIQEERRVATCMH